jgi:hypothetical protein
VVPIAGFCFPWKQVSAQRAPPMLLFVRSGSEGRAAETPPFTRKEHSEGMRSGPLLPFLSRSVEMLGSVPRDSRSSRKARAAHAPADALSISKGSADLVMNGNSLAPSSI